jgi:uncharacterized protein (UPF0333 family)
MEDHVMKKLDSDELASKAFSLVAAGSVLFIIAVILYVL